MLAGLLAMLLRYQNGTGHAVKYLEILDDVKIAAPRLLTYLPAGSRPPTSFQHWLKIRFLWWRYRPIRRGIPIMRWILPSVKERRNGNRSSVSIRSRPARHPRKRSVSTAFIRGRRRILWADACSTSYNKRRDFPGAEMRDLVSHRRVMAAVITLYRRTSNTKGVRPEGHTEAVQIIRYYFLMTI